MVLDFSASSHLESRCDDVSTKPQKRSSYFIALGPNHGKADHSLSLHGSVTTYTHNASRGLPWTYHEWSATNNYTTTICELQD